jgi:hypothetical protein
MKMTRIKNATMIDNTGQFPEGIGKALTIAEQLEAIKGTMSLSEFAEIVTKSYFTVYKWVRTADLPAKKITGSYWIDPVEAARWWRKQSTAITKPLPSVRRHPIKTVAREGTTRARAG